MRNTLAVAVLVLVGMPAFAHRLDEYLQGTILSIEKSKLQAYMTLTPGVAVASFLIASIDTDGNGVISETEQRAYAGQVLRDLSLKVDGYHLTPQLLSLQFPTVDAIKEGRGEIQIEFNASLPPGGHNRKITLENHHQSRISAYQVNCLLPRDRNVRIAAQNRNYSQSLYQMEYVQADVGFVPSFLASWSGCFMWLGSSIVVLLFTRFVLVKQQQESKSA
jgi:hypothetical protein